VQRYQAIVEQQTLTIRVLQGKQPKSAGVFKPLALLMLLITVLISIFKK